MSDFGRRVDRALSVITAIVVVVMMVHVVAHGVLRHFFNAPIYGTNEIVSYWYLPVVALLGVPAAQLQNEHITVTLFKDRLGDSGQRMIHRFACALGAAVSIGFAWFGFGKALDEMAIGATAGVTEFIMWPVRFLVPVVFVLVAILYLLDLLTARTPTGEQEAVIGERPVEGRAPTTGHDEDADSTRTGTITEGSTTDPSRK